MKLLLLFLFVILQIFIVSSGPVSSFYPLQEEISVFYFALRFLLTFRFWKMNNQTILGQNITYGYIFRIFQGPDLWGSDNKRIKCCNSSKSVVNVWQNNNEIYRKFFIFSPHISIDVSRFYVVWSNPKQEELTISIQNLFMLVLDYTSQLENILSISSFILLGFWFVISCGNMLHQRRSIWWRMKRPVSKWIPWF